MFRFFYMTTFPLPSVHYISEALNLVFLIASKTNSLIMAKKYHQGNENQKMNQNMGNQSKHITQAYPLSNPGDNIFLGDLA